MRGKLTRRERSVAGMAGVVLALHVVGFFILIVLVAPHHFRLGATGGFTVGLGLTAYTLGLRHAFDADHISAIDNTTRKLMAEASGRSASASGSRSGTRRSYSSCRSCSRSACGR